MEQFKLGSVSTGTLKPEDLMVEFATKLYDMGYTAHPLVMKVNHLIMRLWPDSDNKPTIEDISEVVNDLQDALSEICPPFVYFGAHPDDGADFGFWSEWV